MHARRGWLPAAGLTAAYAVLAVAVAVLAARHAQTSGGDATAQARPSAAATVPVPTGAAIPAPSTPATTVAVRPGVTRPPATARPPAAATPTRAPAKPAPRRPAPVPVVPRGVDLALGRPVTVTGHAAAYLGGNVTDGDPATYWEGVAGDFPQTLRVDLGSVTTVGRLELLLPPAADWNRRGQTIAVSGSRDGRAYRTLVAARSYTFDANSAAHNAVTVTVPRGGRRFLELRFLANDGWQAAQLGELRVHSS